MDDVAAREITRVAVTAIIFVASRFAWNSGGSGCEGDSEKGRSANQHSVFERLARANDIQQGRVVEVRNSVQYAGFLCVHGPLICGWLHFSRGMIRHMYGSQSTRSTPMCSVRSFWPWKPLDIVLVHSNEGHKASKDQPTNVVLVAIGY